MLTGRKEDIDDDMQSCHPSVALTTYVCKGKKEKRVFALRLAFLLTKEGNYRV